MAWKIDLSVKLAQALFILLFTAFLYLLTGGGLFTSYYGLMGFGAAGAVLAVFTIYKNHLWLGLLDLTLIAGSFLWYMLSV